MFSRLTRKNKKIMEKKYKKTAFELRRDKYLDESIHQFIGNREKDDNTNYDDSYSDDSLHDDQHESFFRCATCSIIDMGDENHFDSDLANVKQDVKKLLIRVESIKTLDETGISDIRKGIKSIDHLLHKLDNATTNMSMIIPDEKKKLTLSLRGEFNKIVHMVHKWVPAGQQRKEDSSSETSFLSTSSSESDHSLSTDLSKEREMKTEEAKDIELKEEYEVTMTDFTQTKLIDRHIKRKKKGSK